MTDGGSDEEWRRWRLQQQDSASGKQGADPDKKLSLKQERIREKDNFVQKQLADAASLLSSSSSSSSGGGLKFQMPTEWTVTIFTADEKDRNEKKKQQSFADLQRLANNRLKAMYQCWQSEATTLKLQGGTLLMDSRQKTGEQEAKMEALETELKKLRNEVKEKDFKLLAHEKLKDNHTAECDKKVREMSEECEQKLAAQAKRHELDLAEKTNECQRLLASEKEASEKTLAEQAKSFEGKIEMVTMKLEAKALAEAEARHAALTKHGLFRARAAHSMEKWRERCGNLERRLNAKKAVLRTMNLEKELFQDRQSVGITCCGLLSVMLKQTRATHCHCQDLLAKRTAGPQAVPRSVQRCFFGLCARCGGCAVKHVV